MKLPKIAGLVAIALWILFFPTLLGGQNILFKVFHLVPSYKIVGWNIPHTRWNTDVAMVSYVIFILAAFFSSLTLATLKVEESFEDKLEKHLKLVRKMEE